MLDFMVVTKSLITMHSDVLTSSSYIHLKAENSLRSILEIKDHEILITTCGEINDQSQIDFKNQK